MNDRSMSFGNNKKKNCIYLLKLCTHSKVNMITLVSCNVIKLCTSRYEQIKAIISKKA